MSVIYFNVDSEKGDIFYRFSKNFAWFKGDSLVYTLKMHGKTSKVIIQITHILMT